MVLDRLFLWTFGIVSLVGSLIILQAESLEEAKATYAKDPYMKQKVFDRFDVIETKQVFPQAK